MTVRNNAKFSFKEIDEGACFMWCEKHFIKTRSKKRQICEYINAVCLEDGSMYLFTGDEIISIVNAVLSVS